MSTAEAQAARGGYAGRILRVDLSSGEIAVEQPGERFYRTYMGGWGIIAHYLLQELPRAADPLGYPSLTEAPPLPAVQSSRTMFAVTATAGSLTLRGLGPAASGGGRP